MVEAAELDMDPEDAAEAGSREKLGESGSHPSPFERVRQLYRSDGDSMRMMSDAREATGN